MVVQSSVVNRIQQARERGVEVVVYEAALIVENGLQKMLDGLIVVSLPEEEQRQRLCAREAIEMEEATRRLAAQAPLAQKLAVADYVIDNSGDRAATEAAVTTVWDAIRA